MPFASAGCNCFVLVFGWGWGRAHVEHDAMCRSCVRQDQDIGQDDGETGSHSSPASISFDEEDEDLETDAVAADESMALDLDDTQPESSADLSISSTRIHVNPGSETAVTSRSSCDFNANVSSCSGQSPRPEHLYGQDDDDEEQLDEEDDPPCVSSKVIHGCSFRLVYHGSSEIDELQPDSSAASGSWKYRTKKGMVEEAVLKLKVGHRSNKLQKNGRGGVNDEDNQIILLIKVQ